MPQHQWAHKFGRWEKGGNVGFECVRDSKTQLFQIVRIRRRRDRTVKKPIVRESTEAFASYGKDKRHIMIIIGRDTIGMNLKGRRASSAKYITWVDLYRYLCQCEALAKGRAKQKARAEKRKAKLKK